MSEILNIDSIKVNDGLYNVLSNLGTGYDKNSANRYTILDQVQDEQASDMYRTSWMAAKIVDIPAYEMTREWRQFTMQDPKNIEKMEDAEIKFGLKSVIREAIKFSRLFGGSAILIGIDGAGFIHEPLELANIKKDSLRYLRVLDKRNIFAQLNGSEYNPGSQNYMNPEYYNIANYWQPDQSGFRVHRSRIIKFDGIMLPMLEYIANQFWGDSIINRVLSAVEGSDVIHKAISSMAHETTVDVYGIKSLAQTLTMTNGSQIISKRIIANNLFKSLNNAVVLDKDNETFERKPISFAALPEVLGMFLQVCASAADIPSTRLLGSSPDGMNATGDSDIRNFYDSIKSQQEDELRQKLNYLDKILALSELGFLPEDLKFDFNPLWQMSEKETAEIEKIRAERDMFYLREGVITPEIILEQLMLEETYQSITQEYIDEVKSVQFNAVETVGENPYLEFEKENNPDLFERTEEKSIPALEQFHYSDPLDPYSKEFESEKENIVA